MRLTAWTAAFAVALGGVAATPAAAAEPDTVTQLPMTWFEDLAADANHVYVTGGGSFGVFVRDRDGNPVARVMDQPGASGLALSADGGTLFVALRFGDAISAISTTTFTETARYPTGANTCPRRLARSGAKLWFGYGCDQWGGGLGVLDLSGQTPAVHTGLADGFHDAPLLDIAGSRLFAAHTSSTPATLRAFDISGTTLTPSGYRQIEGGTNDIEVTDDGQYVFVTSGYPYHHVKYRTSDLSPAGVYGRQHPYPVAVRTFGGIVAAGVDAAYDVDIRMYQEDGTLIRSYDLGEHLQRAALEFSPDGGTLYAVTGSYFDDPRRLHVLRDPSRNASTVTLVPPAQASIDTPFTLSGRVSPAPPVGTAVKVRRAGAAGTEHLPEALVGADGAFTVADTVAHRGTYTYTATFEGDTDLGPASAAATLYVTGLEPELALSADRATYAYGATANLVASLDSATTNRVVRISAHPAGQAAAVVSSGDVNAGGDRSATYALARHTTFAASFAGDERYEPRTVTRAVSVRGGLFQALSGHYGRSAHHHLYRPAGRPVLHLRVAPNNAGACLRVAWQQYTSGAWRAAGGVGCAVLDGTSRVAVPYGGSRTKGVPYRIRSTFLGSPTNAATTGAWLYFRVTS